MSSPFLPGDLFCISPLDSDTLGKFVEAFEVNSAQVPRAAKLFSHIAGADTPDTIAEALARVTRSPANKYPNPSQALLVLRVNALTDAQRAAIAAAACAYIGKIYGYQKILFDFGDSLLSKLRIFGSDPIFFRKLAFNKNMPICSQLWAEIYWDIAAWKFCGVDPMQVEPDDIGDDFLYNRPWAYTVVFCSEEIKKYLPI